jgi:hypothetical protein
MIKTFKSAALVLLMTLIVPSIVAAVAPAQAAPPTVQYSPGYDARLAEARKAAQIAAQRRLVVVPHLKKQHR